MSFRFLKFYFNVKLKNLVNILSIFQNPTVTLKCSSSIDPALIEVSSLIFNSLSLFHTHTRYICSTLTLLKMKLLYGSVSRSVVSNSLWPHGLQPDRFLYSWNSPGKNTVVSNDSLLQGLFLTQGLNLGLLHCRQILYYLSNKGSPQMTLYALLS